jgi:hypothetical protein
MKLNHSKITIGTPVVFNTLPDATVFEVTQRNGFSIMVRQLGTNNAEQRSDVSLCIKPTPEQLRNA